MDAPDSPSPSPRSEGGNNADIDLDSFLKCAKKMVAGPRFAKLFMELIHAEEKDLHGLNGHFTIPATDISVFSHGSDPRRINIGLMQKDFDIALTLDPGIVEMEKVAQTILRVTAEARAECAKRGLDPNVTTEETMRQEMMDYLKKQLADLEKAKSMREFVDTHKTDHKTIRGFATREGKSPPGDDNEPPLYS